MSHCRALGIHEQKAWQLQRWFAYKPWRLALRKAYQAGPDLNINHPTADMRQRHPTSQHRYAYPIRPIPFMVDPEIRRSGPNTVRRSQKLQHERPLQPASPIHSMCVHCRVSTD